MTAGSLVSSPRWPLRAGGWSGVNGAGVAAVTSCPCALTFTPPMMFPKHALITWNSLGEESLSSGSCRLDRWQQLKGWKRPGVPGKLRPSVGTNKTII